MMLLFKLVIKYVVVHTTVPPLAAHAYSTYMCLPELSSQQKLRNDPVSLCC